MYSYVSLCLMLCMYSNPINSRQRRHYHDGRGRGGHWRGSGSSYSPAVSPSQLKAVTNTLSRDTGENHWFKITVGVNSALFNVLWPPAGDELRALLM